ncbi:MAG: hypothetical protein B6D46_12260 [Polyangiaceae bacterium UTPRO1]|jgi:hypothetical protein|nr:hypothetical protein [Myxococcales bacterium]OQY65998.1 MAG: hypothetical protein B6D46_12260 [Polyangiaceae bacterium UTPRO1]
MTETTLFPSKQWFQALARLMDKDESAYRDLGPLECTMVVKVDTDAATHLYEVVFEGFKVQSVRELKSLADAKPEHFVIEATLSIWREMIENIRANAGPDLTHTLNYLTFPDDPMRVSGPDQLEVDAFYRYNQSLQRFFNAAAEVPTAFAS